MPGASPRAGEGPPPPSTRWAREFLSVASHDSLDAAAPDDPAADRVSPPPTRSPTVARAPWEAWGTFARTWVLVCCPPFKSSTSAAIPHPGPQGSGRASSRFVRAVTRGLLRFRRAAEDVLPVLLRQILGDEPLPGTSRPWNRTTMRRKAQERREGEVATSSGIQAKRFFY